MHPANDAFIDDMKFLFAAKIKSHESAEGCSKLLQLTLPELYRRALKDNPRLHGDHEIARIFRQQDRNTIRSWVQAGMSPIIFFAWQPWRDKMANPPLRALLATGQDLSGEALLGNLTPREFIAFLRDAVALKMLNYLEVLQVAKLLPEVMHPRVFHYAMPDHGLFGKAFWRSAEKNHFNHKLLGQWMPLLMLTQGAPDSDFYVARNLFRMHDPSDVKWLTLVALAHSTTDEGHAGLVRYIELQYQDWANFSLDEALCRELSDTPSQGVMSRISFWIDKAVETIRILEGPGYLAWPAAIYAAVYHNFCNEDSSMAAEERRQLHESMMIEHPSLYELRAYIKRESGLVLERALGGSPRVLDLMSAELSSIFNSAEKARYVETVAPVLCGEIFGRVKQRNLAFNEPWKIDRQFEDADPQCAQAIEVRIHEKFGLKDLVDGDDATNARLLHLMLRALRHEHTRALAIDWCQSIRSKKWRPVAMRILKLSPADVKLSASQREEFLAEDLGL